MLRNVIVILVALSIGSCVPLEYVEPVQNNSIGRADGNRDFYHNDLNEPIRIAYQNGASKGSVYYKIDDPYLDIVMEGNRSKQMSGQGDEMVSKRDVRHSIDFYIAAQKAIMKDDLNEANEQINKAIDLLEIQPYYDLKGSLYYLSGDTATAEYYWNYLK